MQVTSNILVATLQFLHHFYAIYSIRQMLHFELRSTVCKNHTLVIISWTKSEEIGVVVAHPRPVGRGCWSPRVGNLAEVHSPGMVVGWGAGIHPRVDLTVPEVSLMIQRRLWVRGQTSWGKTRQKHNSWSPCVVVQVWRVRLLTRRCKSQDFLNCERRSLVRENRSQVTSGIVGAM